MVGMFEEKICSYCKNSECDKKIDIDIEKNMTTYKCDQYIKNSEKIIPYSKPIKVTAKRDYVKTFEF